MMLTRRGSAGVLTAVRDGDDIVRTLASLAASSQPASLAQAKRKVSVDVLRLTTRRFIADALRVAITKTSEALVKLGGEVVSFDDEEETTPKKRMPAHLAKRFGKKKGKAGGEEGGEASDPGE